MSGLVVLRSRVSGAVNGCKEGDARRAPPLAYRSCGEAINRVARKVNEGESIQDLNGYFYGLARLLFMETLRANEKEPIGLDLAPVSPIAAAHEEHERR